MRFYIVLLTVVLAVSACSQKKSLTGANGVKKNVPKNSDGSGKGGKDGDHEGIGGENGNGNGELGVSGSTDGSGVGDSANAPGTTEASSALAKECKGANVKSDSTTVNIPANTGSRCSWNSGGNIGTKGGTITARIERNFPVQISKTRKICSMNIDAGNQMMRYDDQLFLTLNKNVLLSSTVETKNLSDGPNGFKTYNWDPLVGKPSGDSDKYCAPAVRCNLPKTEESGNFNFNIESYASSRLFASLAGADLNIGLIITGDDNPESDCQLYTPLNLKISYTYIE
jgi:hypothetical protein